VPPEAIIAVLGGTITTLAGVIVYFWRQYVAGVDKREGERDRREAILVAERDAWQHRWESSDARLDRLANAFVKAFNRPAPE
jgi:hypothetical protein